MTMRMVVRSLDVVRIHGVDMETRNEEQVNRHLTPTPTRLAASVDKLGRVFIP
jgi:hypothetical protein